MDPTQFLSALTDALQKSHHVNLELTFSIRPKRRTPRRRRQCETSTPAKPKPPPPPELHDTHTSYDLLANAGVNGSDVTRLATTHTPERIQAVLDHINQRKDVRNPAGYIRRALDEGWYRNKKGTQK